MPAGRQATIRRHRKRRRQDVGNWRPRMAASLSLAPGATVADAFTAAQLGAAVSFYSVFTMGTLEVKWNLGTSIDLRESPVGTLDLTAPGGPYIFSPPQFSPVRLLLSINPGKGSLRVWTQDSSNPIVRGAFTPADWALPTDDLVATNVVDHLKVYTGQLPRRYFS